MKVTRNIMIARHNETDCATPVLFIACAGRSGSTLLDRIIGMHNGFFSAGELRFIWERAFGANQLCGCGVPFDQCTFWGQVSRGVFGVGAAEVDATAAIRLRRSLDEIRYAPWLIQSHSPAFFQSSLFLYGKLLERLYETILGVSGMQIVVDSSGDATHGLILTRLPNIELHVVHLIRDPRAVAFSWKRARRRPEIHWKSEDMPVENVRTSAFRWVMHNTMAELLAKSAASYHRVRYEDFVADPGGALSRILAPYEWVKGVSERIAGKEAVLKQAHTVSGNPMRFEHGGLEIKLDDEWRQAMTTSDRRMVTAITLPWLARYGYRVPATLNATVNLPTASNQRASS
jgi:hypothetical protein